MSETAIEPKVASHGRTLALWAGLIGAPMVWAVQLQFIYAMGEWACKSKGYAILHLASLVFVILALCGAALSFADYRAAGGGKPDATDGGPIARTRFLGALGGSLAVYSAIVIVAQAIASFFFNGCPA